MDFYRKAPVWEQQHDCPNTTKLAKPIKPVKVKNARVIEVQVQRVNIQWHLLAR